MIGKYVIVRGQGSGVFAGILKEKKGQEVRLTDCRRLWYWDGASSISQIAIDGVKNPNSCKFSVAVDDIIILDTIEILKASKISEECIRNVFVWKK